MHVLELLCAETGTEPDDWEEVDGPDSGVGVEYYFQNKHSGQTAYICDDQGDVSISLGEDDCSFDESDDDESDGSHE